VIIILVFITSSIWHELDRSELIEVPNLVFLGIHFRYYDFAFLLIFLLLCFELLKVRKVIIHYLLNKYTLWTILMFWLIFITIISIPNYGIVSALGEFREYYHYLFLIPFIVVYYKNSTRQWELFKIIMSFAIVLLILTLVRAAFEFNFKIESLGEQYRWLRSPANLGLLYGAFALFVSYKYKLIKLPGFTLWAIIILILLITIINSHRAVWAAVVFGSLTLFYYKEFSYKYIFNILFIIAFIILILSGLGVNIFELIQERSKVFTSFEEDTTSRWRYLLWLQAIDAIINNPISGIGFGQHFQIVDFDGEIVGTHVHNYYLSLGYHAGITAIIIYLLFGLKILVDMNKTIGYTKYDKRSYVILLTAIFVLLSSHIYYVAFGHEIISWLYIGLGLAVANSNQHKLFLCNDK